MKKQIAKYYKSAKTSTKSIRKRSSSFISRHPIIVFIILLAVLLGLIAGGSFLRQAPEVAETEISPKTVSVYRVGETATFTTNAKLEKSGVTTIVAQTAGIVSSINKNSGDAVGRGQSIVSLSTNYQGGNAASVQRQIAYQQKKLVDETYDDNKNLIQRQRDAANLNFQNSDELRKITNDSISASKDLLSLNQDILNSINDDLEELENATNAADNEDLILATKQIKAQYQATVNQLDTTIKNQDYSTDTDNPPHKLTETQRDIAIKQLDIQEKSLDINKDIAGLQLKLTRVNEALMFPASPFIGTVERVFVRVGQAVNPGTPIAVVSGNEQNLTAIVQIPQKVAQNLNKLESSQFILPSGSHQAQPFYVSGEATTGQMYTAFYSLPSSLTGQITNDSYAQVIIPLGYPDTSANASFIPLDAIYQSAQEDIAFVVDASSTASPVTLQLGTVFGSQVQVLQGLQEGMSIILNRNVVAGDPVQVNN